jgi:hypothetical protein
VDGARVGSVGVEALARPKPLFDLIEQGRPSLDEVVVLRVASAIDGKERILPKLSESHPGKVPTLFAQGGLVAFGLRRERGGYEEVVVDVGAIEIVTNRPQGGPPSVFVVAGREPVTVDDEFLQAARGARADAKPAPAERRGHEKDGHDDDGKGEDGEGRGKGEHDGGGDGHGEGQRGGDGRMGVKLAELVRHYAKATKVREVVLTDEDGSTFVVDAKLFADRAMDLRLKINGQGQLRFRQYKGPATKRDIVKQLEDVKRIEVR